jgi:uncharacterized protein YdeI (YjbR/CyaY-like superfamily)
MQPKRRDDLRVLVASHYDREAILILKSTETFSARNRDEFRQWLTNNHATQNEIWLVIYKKTSGEPSITHEEAVEEALCFGWIDSSMKSLDPKMYIQHFTPRRTKSNWSEANEFKARRLIAEGKMTEAGRAALPPDMKGK